MNHHYDYKKFALLYVDDEELSLKGFARTFGDEFNIITANSAREGLRILEERKEEIGLLLTDQKMPGERGVWLLERARHICPNVIRVLVTAYAEMDAAIEAVNTGAIYKYISKPWDPPVLVTTLKRGLEFFMVQRERDQLLREKMSVLHNMMVADRIVSLGLLATGLSHHIRNSLQAVRTFVDLAPVKLEEEKLDPNGLRNPDFWKEYYQNVQQQISKINNLLSDLCAASQDPEFQFRDELRLNQVIPDVLQQLRSVLSARQIQVRTDIPESLPSFRADKPKIYRLFELLLKDEAVSLPTGGLVIITARAVRQSAHEEEIEIEIKDNGPGMPKEALTLLFDPFTVRSDTPLEYGIHLMGCYFIVHHHGGRIEASTESGQGTTFFIRLPTNPNTAPALRDEKDFVQKALLNQTLWEKLIAPE